MSGAADLAGGQEDRRSPAAMLGALGERVTAEATVRRVFGEPVTAHGRTVIPVARVGYGFGAGGGRRGDGGGGAGLGARPAGALEITPQGTRFIAWPEPGRLLAAVACGLAVGLALAAGRRGGACRSGAVLGGRSRRRRYWLAQTMRCIQAISGRSKL